jgi:photoactive yellow protein
MNAQSSQTELPYGLLELDASGFVVRYAPAFEQTPGVKSDDIRGHNFFTEIMPAAEVKDCHDRFRLFMEQGLTNDRFSTTLPAEQGRVKVQILLAKILEKSERGTERFALIRLMPDESSA